MLNVNHALVACGVDNRDQLEGKTAAGWIFKEVSNDSFSLTTDIRWESVNDYFIYLPRLTVTNIRLNIYP